MENTVRKIAWYSLLTLIMVVIIGVIVFTKKDNQQLSLGGSAGEPYDATSTYSGIPWADILLKTGQGTLGSFIVLGADTTQFDILNATTTDVNKRTGNKATSSILMVSVPSSATAGVYTFDSIFTDGLYVDVKATGVGATTLTWK